MAYKTATKELQTEIARLRKAGMTLPRHPMRAAETAAEMRRMATNPGQLSRDVGSTQHLEHNAALIQSMRRRGDGSLRKTASGVSDISLAIPRFYDPMEYWDLSGLPWNMADEGHRHKLHKWMRLYYSTHYLVPILIDIFTRFPLVGMNLYSKDRKLTQFYEELFLDRLNYPEFLVSLGREYWTVGEAFPLGSFNESLGVWEREELINPEDIVIERFPLLGTQQIKIVPPEYLKRLVETKSPPKEYKMLQIGFPELIPYLLRGEPFPVSDVMLKQVAFKITDWDDHGTPMLLRGLRTLMHEEKLLASQDAIAERLYSPLLLAKLGTQDLGGNNGPWIPGPEQLEAFRDDLDVALSSDFRVLVHHFALELESVFGREQMPDLGNDFDRVQMRLMQVFGLNPGLLSAGANSQPYASSALQAEFMNQILRTFQGYLRKFYEERAYVVAEAQEHYDYEKRGQTRIPIMEEVVEEDEDGNLNIVQKHKLIIPDLEFETLDLRDEATERQFLQMLRQMGAPISDERMMVGLSFDFKDTLDEMQEELIQKTVAQQMAKLQTYKILTQQGLPVPPDLRAEVEGQGQAPQGMGGPGAPGSVDVGAPQPGGSMGIVMPPPPPGMGGDDTGLGPGGIGGTPPGGGPPPMGPGGPAGPPGNSPAISNERRPGLTYNTHTGSENGDNRLLEVDDKIAKAQSYLEELETKKRLRKNAREDADDTDEKWDHSKPVLRKSNLSDRIRRNLLD